MTDFHQENAKKYEVFAWLHLIKSQAHSKMGMWHAARVELDMANNFISTAEDKQIHLLVVGERQDLPGREARIRGLVLVLKKELGLVVGGPIGVFCDKIQLYLMIRFEIEILKILLIFSCNGGRWSTKSTAVPAKAT